MTKQSWSVADPAEVRRSTFLFLACVLVLMGIGTVMVYSAAGAVSAGRASRAAGDGIDQVLRPLWSHGAKVGIGLALMVTAALLDYRRLRTASRWFYLAVVVLLALVLIPGIGVDVKGARRWFQFSFLPFALQPSEFAKLALVLFLAATLSRVHQAGQRFRQDFLPLAAVVLLPATLILAAPDLGAFLLLCGLGFILIVLAGAPLRHFLALGVVGVPALVWLVVTRLDHVVARFTGFQDPLPTSQLAFGLSSLSVGGLTGVGLGGGRFKLVFLSEAQNDFILAVIGEELGFLGTTAVVLLFATLLWSGGRLLNGIRDPFGFYLVTGVLLVIGTQALINLAVATGCVPTKGMSLPFVSAGGSSLTALCLGVGLVVSVARHGTRPADPTPLDSHPRRGRTHELP